MFNIAYLSFNSFQGMFLRTLLVCRVHRLHQPPWIPKQLLRNWFGMRCGEHLSQCNYLFNNMDIQEELMFEAISNPPKGKGKEKDVGKRRAYVRVVTSLGGASLNLELFCEKVCKDVCHL